MWHRKTCPDHWNERVRSHRENECRLRNKARARQRPRDTHVLTCVLGIEIVFTELKRYGLLLQTDAHLPSVCSLVAGEPVKGSWWGHPRSQEMFNAISDLEEHADVLVTKLVSHKVTYLHRSLWPALIAVGQAREPWQVAPLSRQARQLLRAVDRQPVLTDREISKAGSELERNLLVSVEQFHTESGSHARRLESW